jgi:hypothetical protein
MSAEKLGFLRDLLLTTESPAGMVVNLTIFLLLVIGLVDVIAAVRRLWRERAVLLQTRKTLSSAAKEGVLGGGVDVVAVLGVPRKSLVGRRVERVLELRSAGLRHPGMLRELTGDRLAGYGALARYIGAILTLLGLLGTVLGLSFALFNIQEALGRVGDLAAFPELIRALGQTLLGMRTAFACTMAGLVAALLLSACNHLVSRLQARVAADLEELVTCELLVALERIDPGADEAARVFAQLLVDAGRQLTGLREQVTAAAAVYNASSRQMAAATQALGTHVDLFGRSAAEIAAGQRAVAEAAGEMTRALHASQEANASSLDRHMQELRVVVAQNQETVTGLATAQSSALLTFSDLVADVRTRLAVEGPAETAETLALTLEATRAVLQDLRRLTARFEPAILESHQQLRSAVEAALAEIRTGAAQILTDFSQQQQQAIASQVSSLEAALAKALSQKLTALDQMKEQNQEGIDRLVDGQSAALQVFKDLVADVRDHIGPLGERRSSAGNGRGSHATAQVRL